MREIEAIIRLIVGAALVDGTIDTDEIKRLRSIARSAGAGRVLSGVLDDLYTQQHVLKTPAQVLDWVNPSALRIARSDESVRFLTLHAITRLVNEDGRVVDAENTYQEAILEIIGMDDEEAEAED